MVFFEMEKNDTISQERRVVLRIILNNICDTVLNHCTTHKLICISIKKLLLITSGILLSIFHTYAKVLLWINYFGYCQIHLKVSNRKKNRSVDTGVYKKTWWKGGPVTSHCSSSTGFLRFHEYDQLRNNIIE